MSGDSSSSLFELLFNTSIALDLPTDPRGLCFGVSLAAGVLPALNNNPGHLEDLKDRLHLVASYKKNPTLLKANTTLALARMKRWSYEELSETQKKLIDLYYWLVNLNLFQIPAGTPINPFLPQNFNTNHHYQDLFLDPQILSNFIPGDSYSSLSICQAAAILDQDTCSAWFYALQDGANRHNTAIAITVANSIHIITISYLPKLGTWTLIDANSSCLRDDVDRIDDIWPWIQESLLADPTDLFSLSSFGLVDRRILEEISTFPETLDRIESTDSHRKINLDKAHCKALKSNSVKLMQILIRQGQTDQKIISVLKKAISYQRQEISFLLFQEILARRASLTLPLLDLFNLTIQLDQADTFVELIDELFSERYQEFQSPHWINLAASLGKITCLERLLEKDPRFAPMALSTAIQSRQIDTVFFLLEHKDFPCFLSPEPSYHEIFFLFLLTSKIPAEKIIIQEIFTLIFDRIPKDFFSLDALFSLTATHGLVRQFSDFLSSYLEAAIAPEIKKRTLENLLFYAIHQNQTEIARLIRDSISRRNTSLPMMSAALAEKGLINTGLLDAPDLSLEHPH